MGIPPLRQRVGYQSDLGVIADLQHVSPHRIARISAYFTELISVASIRLAERKMRTWTGKQLGIFHTLWYELTNYTRVVSDNRINTDWLTDELTHFQPNMSLTKGEV
jgi:hypothetical protein